MPAYRINVTTYTVSLLAEKTARRIDLEAIWKRQEIGKAIAEITRLWAPIVFKALLDYSQSKTVHIDSILKSQATWEHMLSLDLRISKVMERELLQKAACSGSPPSWSHQRNSSEFSNEDHTNVARCMELSSAQWMAVVEWGNGPGNLEKWQLGIATTLASYAAQGWTRSPSSKQAKHGAAIIEVARATGIFSQMK